MYEIIISNKAFKQISKLEKNIQERIFKVLDRIRIRPEVHLEKLVGKMVYKLRVGDYRLIIDLDKNKLIILVLKVDHRRNIYKK